MDAWQDTYATLHMWMQIVGKKNPAGPEPNGQSLVAGDAVSHRLGLTTLPIPYGAGGQRGFLNQPRLR